MADNKQDRDNQAHDERRRQQERIQELDRAHADKDREGKGNADEQLGSLNEKFENLEYPITTEELIEEYGGYKIKTRGGKKSLSEILSETENETYASADNVRNRLLELIDS